MGELNHEEWILTCVQLASTGAKTAWLELATPSISPACSRKRSAGST